jgi:hypothetical protein
VQGLWIRASLQSQADFVAKLLEASKNEHLD